MAEKTEKKIEKVQINVRLEPELHRAVAIRANIEGIGYSEMLSKIITDDCAKYPKLMKTIGDLINGIVE